MNYEKNHAKSEYYGAAEPPVRCGEALPQLSVNRIEIKVPK